MIAAEAIEMSVTKSLSQDYTNLDDLPSPTCTDSPWFKLFTLLRSICTAPSVNSNSICGMLTSSHLTRQEVKPRSPLMEGNFVHEFQSSSQSCTSVPLLYTTLIFSFYLVRLRKHLPPWKKVLTQNVIGPVLHIQVFKRIHYCRVVQEVC